METSLKPGFAQIFSCCPKNLSCPKFGGAAAPLAPPARTPMTRTAIGITQTGYTTKTSSDGSIDLCVLRDAYHKLFCVFRDFYSSWTPDAEVTKPLNIIGCSRGEAG